MFCKQCGTEIGQNDKFCPGCGAPVADRAPVAGSYIDPAPGNPLLAAGRSPLFLVAVICASVVTLLQVISLFISVGMIGSYIQYMEWMGGDQDVTSVLRMTQTLTVVFVLVSLVMSALLLIGLWMSYAAGVRERASLMEKGLRLIRGTLMAQMIYMIVMLALLAFALLMLALVGGVMGAATSGYDYYDYYGYDYYNTRVAASMLKMVSMVGLVVIAVVGTLMVIFYLKARKAVGHAITAAQTGRADGVPSMYLIVMCFIIGALSVFSMVVSLAASEGMTVMPLLSSAVSAAQSILFGVVALRWRERALAAS